MSIFDNLGILGAKAAAVLHIATTDAPVLAQQASELVPALQNAPAKVAEVIGDVEGKIAPAEKLVTDLKNALTKYDLPDIEAVIGDFLTIVGVHQVQAAESVAAQQG